MEHIKKAKKRIRRMSQERTIDRRERPKMTGSVQPLSYSLKTRPKNSVEAKKEASVTFFSGRRETSLRKKKWETERWHEKKKNVM